MFLEIDFHSGVPIYRQLMRQVRGQIMSGQLAQGAQLETVRELAGRLKVNPMTVSKAYSLLEGEGLLERRRGVGLFVVGVQPERREVMRGELLAAALEKAAVTALQLGVTEDAAVAGLREQYQRYLASSGVEDERRK